MIQDIYKIWNDFKCEIKYKNRFFVSKEFENMLEQYFKPNMIKLFPSGTVLKYYRIREGEYYNSSDKEILEAPIGRPGMGRCNPIGISYLYAAGDIQTAICEVVKQASKKHGLEKTYNLTVAELDVDLSNVFSFLPYKFDYMYNSCVDVRVKPLFDLMNEEFGRMVNNTNQLEYIPLQYVAEYIKKEGFDGFIYSSAITGGIDLVLFNPQKRMIARKGRIFVSTENILNYNLSDVLWN